MMIVRYNPGMQITNTAQLARGTGAKYLEVMVNGEGPLVAVAWRRTKPRSLARGRALVEFVREPKKVANFEATQCGYRVTIKAGSRVVASEHFAGRVVCGFMSREEGDKAYAAAKAYAAGFGCN